ncbi:hypothetical protein [Acutalibacter muris]|uniref:hypothetical protein n=1 Tax=Acutalibacter muris TaxID=1796620 RepID=UPI001C3E9D0A|nr:hypothetical protein [Acutalibacter muris]
MTFDSGTWWLAVLLLGFLTGALIYLLKRSLFGRVDRLDESVKKLDESTVKKPSYEKDKDKLTADIERIERDYTPRSVHEKSYDELRADIKKIMETHLTKDDFIREITKLDRKTDIIYDHVINQRDKGA